MILLELLLTLPIIFLAIPVLLLLAQVIAAIHADTYPLRCVGPRPSVAVLIPAHNEQINIAETVAGICSQLVGLDRILVIADNCSDQTADFARIAGAIVFERNEPERRGKGFALDCGVAQLVENPPDVVVIIDADCSIGSGAIAALALLAQATNRPVQAHYCMLGAAPQNWATRIAVFAYRVKSYVRPLGYHRFGLPCQLQGTGMAFPWKLIESAPLASGQLVEDMKLGLDLAVQGAAPLFCPSVTVTSQFPTSQIGVDTQRTRWEHGHLAMMISDIPRAAWLAIKKRDMMLMALALDGMVPPIALLALLVFVAGLFGGLLACVDVWSPVLVSLAVLCAFSAAILLAWWHFGRSMLALSDLRWAGLYVLLKVPLYIRFLIKRQITWIRTERD